MRSRSNTCLIPLLILFSALFGLQSILPSVAAADEAAPVQLGSSCSESNLYFVWLTETKTQWKLTSALGVPDGYLPSEWAGKDAFLSSLNSALSGSAQIPAVADAVIAVWQQSFQGSAMLYAMFERSVTTETRNIQCTSGTWQVAQETERVSTQVDSSGWIPLGTEAVSQYDMTAAILAQTITDLLTKVNSQPGADTTPFDSYTRIAE